MCSTASYYLFKNPDKLQRLQQEIRSAFKTYDEIDGTSTQPLKYLNAVALEAMRIYPPLPFALPRVVARGGDTVEGHFLPEGVSIGNALLSSFDDPDSIRRQSFLRTRLQPVWMRRTFTIHGNSFPSAGSVITSRTTWKLLNRSP